MREFGWVEDTVRFTSVSYDISISSSFSCRLVVPRVSTDAFRFQNDGDVPSDPLHRSSGLQSLGNSVRSKAAIEAFERGAEDVRGLATVRRGREGVDGCPEVRISFRFI